MRNVLRLAPIALALAALAPAALAAEARVRVIHASPDAPSVDVLVNNSIRAFQSVDFNEITGYAPLPGGVYNAKVVPAGGGAGQAVIDADLNLLYYRSYTVVAVGKLGTGEIAPLVLEDTADPLATTLAPGSARVRFVHASPDAPAVDIKVAGGPVLFSNVSFRGTGSYVLVPAGRADLEVRVAGTDIVALSVPGLQLRPGVTYTILATGFATPGSSPSLGAIVAEDSSAPPAMIRPVARGRR